MATAGPIERERARVEHPPGQLAPTGPDGGMPTPGALPAAFLRSYAALWALGLGFLWWPLLLLRALRSRRPLVRPDLWPTLVAALLALSLVGAVLAGAPLGRVTGASYNLAVWITLAALTVVRLDVDALCRGIAQLAGLQSIAVLGALALYPLLSGAKLPAAQVLPAGIAQEPAFESFLTIRLVVEGYFGSVVLRTGGFFGNATWAGALAALGLLVTVRLVARATPAARTWYVVLGVLDAVTLYLSYSRNTWLALGLALTAMLFVVLRRARYWHALTVAVILGCGVGLYVAGSTDLGRLFAQYNSVREGSLGSRTAIYAATWQAVQELPFPLLGNGVKDRVPGLVASLGTHSGYLGTLYRGGWMALGCLLVWLVVLAVRSWRAVSPLAMGSTVFAAVWFVAEDIDAGHLAPLALVVALAAIGEAAGSRVARGATAISPPA